MLLHTGRLQKATVLQRHADSIATVGVTQNHGYSVATAKSMQRNSSRSTRACHWVGRPFDIPCPAAPLTKQVLSVIVSAGSKVAKRYEAHWTPHEMVLVYRREGVDPLPKRLLGCGMHAEAGRECFSLCSAVLRPVGTAVIAVGGKHSAQMRHVWVSEPLRICEGCVGDKRAEPSAAHVPLKEIPSQCPFDALDVVAVVADFNIELNEFPVRTCAHINQPIQLTRPVGQPDGNVI